MLPLSAHGVKPVPGVASGVNELSGSATAFRRGRGRKWVLVRDVPDIAYTQVLLYDMATATTTTPVTDGTHGDILVQINNSGQIVWEGDPGGNRALLRFLLVSLPGWAASMRGRVHEHDRRPR